MEDITKKPYEISIWEDVLTYVLSDGEKQIIKKGDQVLGQYYKEHKIAIIGSNNMTSPIRAIKPKLHLKINGETELIFSLYTNYYDEDTDRMETNPFVGMMVNERKIKLQYEMNGKVEWYDFIIKEIEEDSDNNVFTYHAKSLFINELSKTGFNLEFDKDLENNIGNLPTLASRVLADSDWNLSSSQPVIKQTKEEPLCGIILSQNIVATSIFDEKQKVTIQAGQKIYGFYTVITNKETYFQFVYVDEKVEPYIINDDRVIQNDRSNFYIEVGYKDGKIYYDNQLITNGATKAVSPDYRGRKFIRKQIVKYDPIVDKYVSVYTYNDGTSEQDVYGFTEREYLTSAAIQSYITSGYDFYDTSGWAGGENSTGVVNPNFSETPSLPDLDLAMIPDIRDVPLNTPSTSFLKISSKKGQVIFNSGMTTARQMINNLSEGETYIFRIKYGVENQKSSSGRPLNLKDSTCPIKVTIAPYTLSNGHYVISAKHSFEGRVLPNMTKDKEGYYSIEMSCRQGLSYKDMLITKNQLGIFFEFEQDGTYYIENVQLFKKQLDGKGEICYPNKDLTGEVKTKYFYYFPTSLTNESTKDSINYIQTSTPRSDFLPKYNDNNFEKIRMITAKESNRFNLLQDLCEIFECWVGFKIEHQPNGEILLGKDSSRYKGNCPVEEMYRQQKWVEFYESVEKENEVGFTYGINLKAIKRNLESSGVVSKIIVKNNSNDAATDGFCSIARATENESGENFIYDFSYYINQGMLNFSVLNNDLYMEESGYLGYYSKLKRINVEAQRVIEEQSLLRTQFANVSSRQKTYQVQKEKTEEELVRKQSQLFKITGRTYEDFIDNPEDKDIIVFRENDEVNSILQTIKMLLAKASHLGEMSIVIDNEFAKISAQLDKNKEFLDQAVKDKEKYHKAFYKKYSRFIQEGSWIQEDYHDDNLYYLDAASTLHTSSQPKVKYSIDVLELSQLEGYENYRFSLGEKTYVEDTEFFGWVVSPEGIKTPYREEIIVTELHISLDSPEENQVIVQNYKQQFEDLFQRITATTQSVEFHSGQYGKAANAVETNGEIKFSLLQNSISHNSVVLQNAKNQSVIWDDTGITTTSLDSNSMNEIVRIVSGGIFVSDDGGAHWNTGITGTGINASAITTGQINTQRVIVTNDAFPTFLWDSNGISAYAFTTDKKTGLPYGFNHSTFVRLDQYGLYSIRGQKDFNPNLTDKDTGLSGEEKIKFFSDFSLTWSGFKIKSKHDAGGYISITSNEDFQVINNKGVAQVKIGLLYDSLDNPIYGIEIRNNKNEPVITQDDAGEVTISGLLQVAGSNSGVTIGPGKKHPTKTDVKEVINSQDKFVVYDDGSVKAAEGEFTGAVYATSGKFEGEVYASSGRFEGEIIATSGKIGNLTIGEVEQTVTDSRHLEIQAENGTTFKINGIGKLVQKELNFTAIARGFDIKQDTEVKWYGSSDNKTWGDLPLSTGLHCTIDYQNYHSLFVDGIYFLKAVYQDQEAKSDVCPLSITSDGITPVQVIVENTTGNVFINGDISALLQARVFRGNQEITHLFAPSDFSWIKYSEHGEIDQEWTTAHQKYGSSVAIDHLSVDRKAKFVCDLNLDSQKEE